MAAIKFLSHLFDVSSDNLSKQESVLLEIDLFIIIYDHLFKMLKEHHKEYLQIIKLTTEMEEDMLEKNLMQFIINDILETGEYTLQGIAMYAHLHEDVVNELAYGINMQPSVSVFRKIIEIHKSVKQECYQQIRTKLLS